MLEDETWVEGMSSKVDDICSIGGLNIMGDIVAFSSLFSLVCVGWKLLGENVRLELAS